MFWNGKIIGIFLGSLLGGLPGAVMGLVLGHLFDIGWFNPLLRHFGFSRGTHRVSNVQQIFFNSTFTTMGYLAKSDGYVSENEIRAARQIMTRLNLSDAMRREAINLFNEGKQTHFNIDRALNRLKLACWHHPSLLRLFLEIQSQMAYADGSRIREEKRAALEYICHQLGVREFNFHNFENRYRAEQHYYQHKPRSSATRLKDAYKILEISSTATDAEVKKTYRRQMSKNHPDKLLSKGLPPEMIKLATQRTQQIKEAYETIKKARGTLS